MLLYGTALIKCFQRRENAVAKGISSVTRLFIRLLKNWRGLDYNNALQRQNDKSNTVILR